MNFSDRPCLLCRMFVYFVLFTVMVKNCVRKHGKFSEIKYLHCCLFVIMMSVGNSIQCQ
jgi:hypothetical protein